MGSKVVERLVHAPEHNPGHICGKSIFLSSASRNSMASIENLQFWMPRFINEIRRKDGTDYSPNTLTNIAAGIQRYLREKCNRPAINFLKKMIQHLICSEKAWTLE